MRTKNKVFSKVYLLVKKIPRGKVTTYGALAKELGLKDSRIVGWALHTNRNLKVPCHRVVNENGKLAENYVFGGLLVQKEKLVEEEVSFRNKNHIDLKKHLYRLRK